MPEKKKVVANNSLSQLSNLINAAGIHLRAEKAPRDGQAKNADVSKLASDRPAPAATDEEIFLEAMNGIHRTSWRHSPHPSSRPEPMPVPDPDFETQRLMQSAIDQDTPMPVSEHPEYIEGWIGVAGRKFLPKLRNGLYSIQGQIDLHGYNRAEAQIAVEDYIAQMSRFRSCCVKIIHGRGINSPTDKATLKEGLQRLLRTRRMSRYVVAFASAASCDGGVGAVYVLLRRQ